MCKNAALNLVMNNVVWYKIASFACFFCVSVPEVSRLRAQVFVHGVQGAHAAIFL